MKKKRVSWSEIDQHCKHIAETIKAKKSIQNIYGLPRGGLIPAVILSHLTGLPIILERKFISSKTVVIDDIVDKGETIKILKDYLRDRGIKPYIASLYFHPQSKIKPNRFIALKGNDWLVFPWETLTSSKYDN